MGTPRVSHDIGIFNDSEQAVAAAFAADVRCLREAGYDVSAKREESYFREASVSRGGESTDIKWARAAAAIMRKWHEMVWAARETIALLPPEEAGKCVACADGTLFRGTDDELREALDAGRIVFHEGCIGGAWPRIAGI